jgi:hypothetical protein
MEMRNTMQINLQLQKQILRMSEAQYNGESLTSFDVEGITTGMATMYNPKDLEKDMEDWLDNLGDRGGEQNAPFETDDKREETKEDVNYEEEFGSTNLLITPCKRINEVDTIFE